MDIGDLIIDSEILDKLIWKHNVTETEVRQIFLDAPKYRFIEKGRYAGEHLYLALGATDSGRYLSVLIVTARDMSEKERRRYAKK